jgi:hypothetical protein
MTVQTEIPGVHMEAYIALLESARSNRTDFFDSLNKRIDDRPVEECRISVCEDHSDQPGVSVCFTKFATADECHLQTPLYARPHPRSRSAVAESLRLQDFHHAEAGQQPWMRRMDWPRSHRMPIAN